MGFGYEKDPSEREYLLASYDNDRDRMHSFSTVFFKILRMMYIYFGMVNHDI